MEVGGQEIGEMMTSEEIRQGWEELQRMAAQIQVAPVGSASGIREELEKLAVNVGACTRTIWQGGLAPVDTTALVQSIHQALQTASMIDACRTAAENVGLAKNAQAAASKAQWVAFGSMLAAWAAVVVNIVVAYIMAAMQ